MSESILPWISAYFIASGEEYGADVAAIPLVTTKKKKVQLVEFLTYGRDEVVWARVSDKEYMVPIRFSRDAVEEYTQFSRSHILEDKNAIISISNFKPFFARIPQGKERMSEESFLALECNSVTLVGGRGEPRFGRPETLETNPDLKRWSEGLKQPGGAGNCLKDRKQVVLQNIPAVSVNSEPIEPPPKKMAQAKAITAPPKSRNFREIWKPLFRRPPEDVAAILASMKVEGDEESNAGTDQNECQPPRKRRRISALPLTSSPAVSQSSSRTRSATPFSEAEWPPSVRPHNDTSPSSSKSAIPASSSHPRHPTPGQRLAVLASPTVVHETMLVPCSTESPPTRSVSRKVPRPPEPFKSERLLAEPIILAPDSDLSLSHSQSQSQSQSGPKHLLGLTAARTRPEDQELDSDDAQTHIDLLGHGRRAAVTPEPPREVEHDARAWAAPSFQVARKSTGKRRTQRGKTSEEGEVVVTRSLKEVIEVKLDGILVEEVSGVVSWEMLHGILVETARDRRECRRHA
ncbi:hypothetical protein J132_05612 [Termitomyces sp. J132]|nr:hypothetical protein J132_05612 [Termitomyces sp. J132]